MMLIAWQIPFAAQEKLKARAGFSDLRQPLLCGPRFRMRLHPENEWRLILVDTLYEKFADQFQIHAAAQANPKDIKYIIVTHAHTDHTGAQTHCRRSRASGRYGRSDWQMNGLELTRVQGSAPQFKPIRRTWY